MSAEDLNRLEQEYLALTRAPYLKTNNEGVSDFESRSEPQIFVKAPDN